MADCSLLLWRGVFHIKVEFIRPCRYQAVQIILPHLNVPAGTWLCTSAFRLWWAIRTKPPTPKIRLIKISPYQNIALFDHDFMAGHTYPTVNHLKPGGSVYKGSAYAGSVYGGSTYGGSARRSARCPARCSALKALRTEALRTEALRVEALHMKALRTDALRTDALHDALY
jgi:hypothetical protein